jgi:hypothetical protein
MLHTPVDFLLSTVMLGSAAAPLLLRSTSALHRLPQLHSLTLSPHTSFPLWPLILSCGLWMINRIVRVIRLNISASYEHRASSSLLNTDELRGTFLVSFALVGLALLLTLTGYPLLALPAALGGVISARYLFFVSVVPLNMALTFVRSVHA